MNGVQTRLKCKPNVKRCKRFVFAAHSPLLHPNTLKTKAIIHFQTDHILTRFVFPPLLGPSHKVMVALKNNMIYDLALAPNVEVEFSTGKRWSLNTEYKCPWWLNSRNGFCYQLLSGGVEVRCWLGNRNLCNRLTGYFLGLYTEGGVYDFQLKEESGIRGKYYMTSGLSCGYARRITGHLAIECSLGIGYLTTEYCKYTSYQGELVRTNGGHFHFVGPTKVAVSLVWHITAGQ